MASGLNLYSALEINICLCCSNTNFTVYFVFVQNHPVATGGAFTVHGKQEFFSFLLKTGLS